MPVDHGQRHPWQRGQALHPGREGQQGSNGAAARCNAQGSARLLGFPPQPGTPISQCRTRSPQQRNVAPANARGRGSDAAEFHSTPDRGGSQGVGSSRRHPAHAAAFVCHPHAQRRNEPAHHPGAARAQTKTSGALPRALIPRKTRKPRF